VKIVATYPDVERVIVDLLADLTADMDPVPTVGVGLPPEWGVGSAPRLQVALDGSGGLPHPIAERSTVRVTAWIAPQPPQQRASTTQAKALAQHARGLLLASTDMQVRPGAGMFPAQDPTTRAELASFTVLVSTRSILISGS